MLWWQSDTSRVLIQAVVAELVATQQELGRLTSCDALTLAENCSGMVVGRFRSICWPDATALSLLLTIFAASKGGDCAVVLQTSFVELGFPLPYSQQCLLCFLLTRPHFLVYGTLNLSLPVVYAFSPVCTYFAMHAEGACSSVLKGLRLEVMVSALFECLCSLSF